MIYGYARVSTKGQDRNGNSLPDQVKKLTEAGCSRIFKDSYTGTKMDRPQFSELMGLLREGDTLVVTKLDRFARTAADGAKTIIGLVERGVHVHVHVLNMGRADNSPMGKLMTQVMLAFAEFERDMIVERTQSGKEYKREHDSEWREGRKELEIPDFEKFLKKQKDGELTVTECCKQLGISRSTWYHRAKQVG